MKPTFSRFVNLIFISAKEIACCEGDFCNASDQDKKNVPWLIEILKNQKGDNGTTSSGTQQTGSFKMTTQSIPGTTSNGNFEASTTTDPNKGNVGGGMGDKKKMKNNSSSLSGSLVVISIFCSYIILTF